MHYNIEKKTHNNIATMCVRKVKFLLKGIPLFQAFTTRYVEGDICHSILHINSYNSHLERSTEEILTNVGFSCTRCK